MSFSFEITANTDVISKWTQALKDAGVAWLETFGKQMLDRTGATFDQLAHGGTYRGVHWPPFRKEPSKSRGGWSARLLEDTGRLRSSVGDIFRVENGRLIFGSRVPYAATQQKLRPFLFFQLPDDAMAATRIATEFIRKALAGDEKTEVEEVRKQWH